MINTYSRLAFRRTLIQEDSGNCKCANEVLQMLNLPLGKNIIGVIETQNVMIEEMMVKLTKGYFHRMSAILTSKLNRGNIVRAIINEHAESFFEVLI